MTKRLYIPFLLNLLSLLPQRGESATISRGTSRHSASTSDQYDSIAGQLESELVPVAGTPSELQLALLRRERSEDSPEEVKLPFDLSGEEDRARFPDLVSNSEVGLAEIDKSGRFVSATHHMQDTKYSRGHPELQKGPLPSKSNAKASAENKGKSAPAAQKKEKKVAPSPLAKPAPTSNFHVLGLSICIALLACIFSLQWRSIKNGREPARELDSHLARSSSEPPPPPVENDGEADDVCNNGKPNDALEFTNQAALKGLQFLALLFITIACTRFLVCDAFKLQCDEGYNLQLFFRQDFHKVVLDMVFLFLIGRLAASSQLPVNSAAFIAIVFISALLPSWSNEMSFMKHSLSMYQMACSWTAMTWVASLFIVGLIVFLVAMHLHHFLVTSGRPEQVRALVEVVVILGIFFLPRAFESGFHMHHWYTMWLLALGCRLPTLWSRGVQAFLIGGYINGIAVYGRDPVLACQAAYDMAYSEQCKFLMMCTWNATGGAVPATFAAPNWRTCDAGDYAF